MKINEYFDGLNVGAMKMKDIQKRYIEYLMNKDEKEEAKKHTKILYVASFFNDYEVTGCSCSISNQIVHRKVSDSSG